MQPSQQPQNPLIDIATALANKLLLDLASHEPSVQDKYEYYDADNDIRDYGISTPAKMVHLKPGIGWASRAINTLSDRVVFEGFVGDKFGINEYLEGINGLRVINNTKHDTYIGGCAFVAVTDDLESDKKILVPFTATEATGKVNQTTGLLEYGLAVTRWAEPQPKKKGIRFAPADYILFTPTYTALFFNRNITEITGRTLLHPLTRRASAAKPLGKSRISNTVRRIIQEVGRLKRREEIAEEFYSLPQRYINGLAEGAKKDEGLDSAIGKVWAITKDEDGDKPDIGQLAQMSIDQFETAKKDKARDFCAETGLTLRNLGYETGNPSSAESLVAMSDDLLLEATNSQEELGAQIKEICITLRLALDDNDQVPEGLRSIKPAWKPVFQVDIGATGDGVFKLFEAMPELQGTIAGYRFLGISIKEAEELAAKRAASTAGSVFGGGQ
jgi:hypothetical protein